MKEKETESFRIKNNGSKIYYPHRFFSYRHEKVRANRPNSLSLSLRVIVTTTGVKSLATIGVGQGGRKEQEGKLRALARELAVRFHQLFFSPVHRTRFFVHVWRMLAACSRERGCTQGRRGPRRAREIGAREGGQEKLRSPVLSSRTVVRAYVSSEQSSFITIAEGKREKERKDTPNCHRKTIASSARRPATLAF